LFNLQAFYVCLLHVAFVSIIRSAQVATAGLATCGTSIIAVLRGYTVGGGCENRVNAMVRTVMKAFIPLRL
jgi:enoyl-CoA hydratase/carnithine racemase